LIALFDGQLREKILIVVDEKEDKFLGVGYAAQTEEHLRG
jgi:hypothetical protein